MSKKNLKIGDTMTPVNVTEVKPVITPEVMTGSTPSVMVTPVTVNPVITPVSASGELELLKAQLAAQAVALAELQAKKPKGFTKHGLAGYESCYQDMVAKVSLHGDISPLTKEEYISISSAAAEKTGRTYTVASAKIDAKYFMAALSAIKSRFDFVAKPITPPVTPEVSK